MYEIFPFHSFSIVVVLSYVIVKNKFKKIVWKNQALLSLAQPEWNYQK